MAHVKFLGSEETHIIFIHSLLVRTNTLLYLGAISCYTLPSGELTCLQGSKRNWDYFPLVGTRKGGKHFGGRLSVAVTVDYCFSVCLDMVLQGTLLPAEQLLSMPNFRQNGSITAWVMWGV